MKAMFCLKEKSTKFNIIVLVVPGKNILDKLVAVNKIAKKNPRISVMTLNKAGLDDVNFTKYIHNVISQVRLAGLKGIFICAKESLNKDMLDDLDLFADLVEEVE